MFQSFNRISAPTILDFFGAEHPFSGPTPDLTRVFNLTQGWFRKYL